MTATLLLSSCASADVSASLDGAVVPVLDAAPVEVSQAGDLAVAESAEILVENECLNCHSDKQRLVETAKPEEIVEAESSGVG